MKGLVFISLLIALSALALEDFKHRTVRVFWFPIVLMLAICYAVYEIGFNALYMNTGVILLFLGVQTFFLLAYFIIKHRKWVDLTDQHIGWGDVLFLLVVVPLFSPFVYILFYVFSLLCTILFVLGYQLLRNRMTFIPLAGIQAVCLICLLCVHQLKHAFLFVNDVEFLMHTR